jgi:hypothetical protein
VTVQRQERPPGAADGDDDADGAHDAHDADGSVVTRLLYLHGFRSSPASFKAQRLAAWIARHAPHVEWRCPQLPPSPAAAFEQIVRLARDGPAAATAVVGSSLGGFYATALAERTGMRAVLINPAVDPARDLAAHIGRQTMFHSPADAFWFRPEYIDELRAIAPPAALRHPARLLAIVAKGDEVLDWREMAARYAAGPLRLVDGSDHGLSDFDRHLPALVAHLGLSASMPS